jgi:RimJ/RimL family protein N-acetyltransferase
VTIRRAEEQDVPAIAAIRAEAWGAPEFWEPRVAAYLSGAVRTRDAQPGSAVFVAEIDGAVVGVASGHRTTRHGCQGELQWMNVAHSQQGRGIAAKLLAAMAAWFVEQNARRVCVDVEPENAVARAFYAKHGAVDLQPSWMVWEDIGAAFAVR